MSSTPFLDNDKLSIMTSMGERIRLIRLELGLSQEEFGKAAAGHSKQAVSGWERDVSRPGWESLNGLQERFLVNPAFLVRGEYPKYVPVTVTPRVMEENVAQVDRDIPKQLFPIIAELAQAVRTGRLTEKQLRALLAFLRTLTEPDENDK